GRAMTSARNVRLGGAVILPAACGCATHHPARPGAFPDGVLTSRRSVGTVAITSTQPKTEWVKVGDAGMGRSLHGNLSQWTDAAIDLLTEKLTASGMTVTNASPKKLAIAVVGAQLGSAGGGWAFKCSVTLSAEGANGLKATYIGERASTRYI